MARLRKRRGAALIATAIVAVAMGLWMESYSSDYERPGLATMTQFEFAGSSERAEEIRDEWGPAGRDSARRAVLIDYGFILGYALFGALACWALADVAARRGRSRLMRLGYGLAWGQLVAGLADAVEDAALLLILGGDTVQPLPALAAVAAGLKFTLVGLALVYALAVLCVRFLGGVRP
jgi:hypothetical protein